MDDIYIYNMYTLSLLKATFQIKQRRGWLCFQEGEDDEDMATIFTPTTPPKIPSGPITRERAHQLNYQDLAWTRMMSIGACSSMKMMRTSLSWIWPLIPLYSSNENKASLHTKA